MLRNVRVTDEIVDVETTCSKDSAVTDRIRRARPRQFADDRPRRRGWVGLPRQRTTRDYCTSIADRGVHNFPRYRIALFTL
jgi:hypothetical protein